MSDPRASIPGATPLTGRALAPDTARGAMLLLIAVANVPWFLHDRSAGLHSYPGDLVGVDAVLATAQTALVDGRAYPLFSLLLGYGVVQLARRQAAAGRALPAALSTVRRRGAAMVAIGLVHGVLLWPGEIVGAYGLLLVLMAGLLVAGTTASLLTTAAVGIGLSSLFGLAVALPREGPDSAGDVLASMAVADPAEALGLRAVEWLGNGLFGQAVAVFGAVALGAWAARYGWLDEPARHRRLLGTVAALGLSAAVLGGLPLGLATGGLWIDPSAGAVALAGGVHALTGFAGGAGYAAAFGLLATRSHGGKPSPIAATLRAGGRRSLSGFIGQSVVFAALLPAWTLGLGATLALWQAAVLAVATWAGLLVLAVGADRVGYRGPAEVLLRRMAYGRQAPADRRG